MNVAHIARVTAGPDSEEVLGTAYPLTATRFLTAGHVVKEVDREFDLVWGAEAPTHRCTVRSVWVRNGDVADKGEVDVAVLELIGGEPPEDLGVFVSSRPLALQGKWESHGFGRAGDASHAGRKWARALPLHGTMSPYAEDTRVVQITAESPPAEAKHWAGISGAPVFIGGILYGVVTNGARGFKGNRLLMVPTHRLMDDDSFVAAAALPQSSRDLRRLRTELGEMLQADMRARQALFGVATNLEQVYQVDGVEGVVEKLLQSTPADIVAAFNYAHQACYVALPPVPESASTLASVLERLLPWLAVRDLVVGVDEAASVVRLPVGSVTAAELWMSGRDGRPYDFGEFIQKMPYPEPEVRRRTGFTIDPTGSLSFREFVRFLHRWLKERDPEDRQLDDGQLAELDRNLAFYSKGQRPIRYYLALEHDQLDKSRAFLDEVRRKLPALSVLILRSSSDAVEQDLCLNLRALVHRERTGGEEYRP